MRTRGVGVLNAENLRTSFMHGRCAPKGRCAAAVEAAEKTGKERLENRERTKGEREDIALEKG